MLPIEKGPVPKKLREARGRIAATPGTTLSWTSVDSEEKAAALDALLAEQGGLCAYCMRGISAASAHVEHIVPQSMAAGEDDPLSVDYQNLLAVCDGFEGSAEGLTCDRARGNKVLSVNPLKPDTLESIRYMRDGRIRSEVPVIAQDLETTLNLNQSLLVRNRRVVLKELFGRLGRYERLHGKSGLRRYCEKYLAAHLSDPSERIPYDGAIIYFMKKRLRAAD